MARSDWNGIIAVPRPLAASVDREALGSIDSADEAAILSKLNQFALDQGLAAGQMAYEVFNENTGEVTAVLDLAWPEGLQAEFSRPVAVLIDEDDSVQIAANDADFRVFASPEAFKRYVEMEILNELVHV